MTIKRGLRSRGRLQVERARGGGSLGEERNGATRPARSRLALIRFISCVRAVFFYIIYFERVHLKNWLRV